MVALFAALITAAGCGGGSGASGDASPTTTTTRTVTGREVFLGASGCGGCHTLADAGATGTYASNLDELRPSEARVREVVANGTAAMPAYDKTLTEREIADLATYVSSVAGR